MQAAYCLMCRTGSEFDVVKIIQRYAPELKVLAPTRVLPEKVAGQWCCRSKALLPGYIFIYSDQECLPPLRSMSRHFYKFLNYELGSRQLAGQDKAYADWLLANQGEIQTSRILATGDQVQIIDGPLANHCGKIVKLDKHKRRAWIDFDFDGQKRTISLGAEFVNTIA